MTPRKPKAAAEAAPAPEADAVAVGVEPAADPSVRPADPERLVVFGMEGQRYALPIDVVQEIQQLVALSEIPDASGALAGVINLRGAVVPAIDLRRLVGLPDRPYDLQTPMVFTRTSQGVVALIVDDVEDVLAVPPGSMQPPSSVYAMADRLIGVCMLDSGLIFVFDIDRLVPPLPDPAGR